MNYVFLAKITLFITLCVLYNIAPASASPFEAAMCNASNLVTGPAGKAFSAVAIIATGIGFFNGKMSWGFMIAVSLGIGAIYGAPTIVSALSGDAVFECRQETSYDVTCSDGTCYNCPTGFTGPSCDTCVTGYTGANCDVCDTAIGYSAYNGGCYLDCTVSGVPGIANTIVVPGTGNLTCDTSLNYSGTVSYTCTNGISYANPCSCQGNYDINSNCTNCLPGYDPASNCTSCLPTHSNVGGTCQQNCNISGFNGITNQEVLPTGGSTASITCNAPYNNVINYTCDNGSFGTSDTCINCMEVTYAGHKIFPTAPAGKVWTSVAFANYGNPSNCGSIDPSCNFDATAIVAHYCLGQNTCEIDLRHLKNNHSGVPYAGTFFTDVHDPNNEAGNGAINGCHQSLQLNMVHN